MICLTPKPSHSFFVYRIQSKKKIYRKELFKKKVGWRLEQKKKKKEKRKEKRKGGFLTALATLIKCCILTSDPARRSK